MHRWQCRACSSILLSSVAALCSCGSGLHLAPYVLPAFAGGTPAYAFYHAYGDSITHGTGLAEPEDQVYAELVSKSEGLSLENHAISGDQACDVPTRQIFPASDNPTVATQGLYTLLVSTNDVGVKGTGAYESIFNLCHQATIAWLALPVENKILATSRSVTTTGFVALETANNWNALTTQQQGASISVAFTHAAAGPLYVWYRITDGDTGSFSYSLDGTVLGEGQAGTTPAIKTQNSTTTSLALIRIPRVPPGAHAFTLTQTSLGSHGVGVVAIGLPPTGASEGLPLVLVGTTPKQLVHGTGACSQSDAPCEAYIADIRKNIALFASDGLNVRIFDTHSYMNALSYEMVDSLHPNPLGHTELAHSVLDALNQ